MTEDLATLLSKPLLETSPLNPEQQAMVDAHMERRRKVRQDMDAELIAKLLPVECGNCGWKGRRKPGKLA